MPELYDGDGNLVDALSLEEVEEKLEEAKSLMAKEYDSELEILQKRIDEKEEALTKVGNKDINFENLRKVKEDLEKKLTEKEKEFNAKFEEFQSQTAKQKIDGIADSLSEGDKDLKEKILYHYNSFSGVPESDEAMKTRIENAHILAAGSKPTIDSKIFATGSNILKTNDMGGSGASALSKEALNILPSMGITEEDLNQAKKQGLI